MTEFFDLSHELATGMPIYPGDPAVELADADQETLGAYRA